MRVDAEIIHDIALSASGLLNGKIGGPRVYPPIPDGVMALGYGAPMPWETKAGDRYRRAHVHFCQTLRAVSFLAGFRRADRRIALSAPRPLRHAIASADDVERSGLCGGGASAGPASLGAWRARTTARGINYAFELCTGRKPQHKEVAHPLFALARGA